MRYANGKYRDCKWCGGQGCIYCEAEANKEYKRQFPDGPKPIATFKTDDAIGLLKTLLGPEAIAAAKQEATVRAHEVIARNSLVAQIVRQTLGMTPKQAEDDLAISMVPEVLSEQIVKASQAGVLIEEKNE